MARQLTKIRLGEERLSITSDLAILLQAFVTGYLK